jgi:GPH family glycoside/pentoside/hexuronide:cation symporter
MCLGYIGYTFSHASEVALYSTVVDYTKWKTGKDLKPFMMTLFSLTPKIGTTVGSAVLGFGLVAVGFVKTNVTPEAINGIRILMSGIPAALAALCAVVMLMFPLTDKKVLQMQDDMVKKGVSI